jgi:hypothetical protein
MVINRSSFLKIMNEYLEGVKRPESAVILKRTIYANMMGLGGQMIIDPKVRKDKDYISSGAFVSTDDYSFGHTRIGHIIRGSFKEKSPYEV